MGTTSLAVPDSKKFESTLSKLKSEAAAIVVNSPETCLEAKTMQRSIRNYIKDAKSALDPFVNMTKRAYDEARDERARWIDPAELIDDGLSAKVKDFERKEREQAAREEEERNREKRAREAREAEEQRKIAQAAAEQKRKEDEKAIAEARKAGELNKREAERMQREAKERAQQAKEQAVKDAEAAKANFVPDKVLPNIPTVASVPSRRNYKFRIIDASRIPRAYLCPDEVKIGSDVRQWKKVGEVIPGVEAYED